MNTNHESRITDHESPAVELVPVEYDAQGRVRRYDVVRIEPTTIEPPQVVDVSPIVSPLPAQPVRLSTVTEGSHADRAKAFSISTWQLSLVTGILFVVAALALTGATVPIFTLALTFFGGFALTWLAAYVLHVLASAEGVELYGVFRLWNFLDREQAERHRRYSDKPQRHLTTGDRVGIALVVVWIVAVLVSWLSVR